MKRFVIAALAAAGMCGVVWGVTTVAVGPSPEKSPLIVAAAAESAIPPSMPIGVTPDPAGVPTESSPRQDGDTGLTGPVVAGVFAIREFGPSFMPDVYAGVGTATPSSDDTLVIALTTADPSIHSRFLAATQLPSEKVEFVVVRTSESRQRELAEQIIADASYLAHQGIDLATTSGGASGYEYTIGVYDLEPIERALLAKRYGPVEVVNVDDSERQVYMDFSTLSASGDTAVA